MEMSVIAKVNLLKYLGPHSPWTSRYDIGMVLYGKKHKFNVGNFLYEEAGATLICHFFRLF